GDGTSRSSAVCRTNRWWDCAAQNDEQACLDRSKRDCHWLGFLQYEQKKCVPYVKPGFKFWEGQGGECAMGNQNKDLFGWTFPRTWGYATFLYCQRLGDCGNYRNIADRITRFGYHNPDGKEEDWVYYAAGWPKRGTEFLIDLGLQREITTAAMPSGPGGGYATCRPWQAPPGGEDCTQCGSKGYKPCTLYQCKSLGRQCIYTEVMGVGKCSTAPADVARPEIELVNVTARTFTRAFDPTVAAVVYSITPGVAAYEPVNISIHASVESQCRLTPVPPNIDLDSLFGSDLAFASYIPDLLLSDGEYRTDHTLQAVFPPFTESHPLFIQCANQAGLENAQPIGLNLNVQSAEPDTQPPTIIATVPELLRKDVAEDVTLWLNEPFSQCSAIGAKESDLHCAANITHLSLDPAGPLGSFPCRAVIQAAGDKVSMACTDIAGNTMVPYELNVTG
ncbi:hypothetical protein HY642_00065, partial [Candidatus Woesearchaeota archaeon]|nr:hypothetical protein [Candidatus Woesearchaeota archaeon]